MNIFNWLTDTSGLTPHGFCLFWEPDLLVADVASDALTMGSYYSIPLALALLMRQRPNFPYRRLALLFIAFIVACGTEHGASILTLWVPAYHLEGAVKAITAALSVSTAFALWPLIPKLMELPSAAEMASLNAALRATIAEQDKTAAALNESQTRLLLAQNQLERSNLELETRIAERTEELLRLNKTMAQSEARFRQVVEASPAPMVMTDKTGRIVLVNAQTERLFHYSRAELLGRPIELLIRERYEGDPKRCAMFHDEPCARQISTNNTLFGKKKNGDHFEVEIGLNPIETEDGVMMLSAIVDISDRVRLDAQILRSQKMEAVGRVTAGVAHDFNNLMQVVGGSLELLLDCVADQPAPQQWGEVALRAITRGSEMTSRLLSFSGKQLLRTQSVAVGKLLEDLRRLISHLFEAAPGGRIELIVVPCAPELAVLADAGQLEAALINLAVNAHDAMPNGGCLRISACEADADAKLVQPGRYGVISVADTGIGMDNDTLAQACEPFFSTKGLNGTGLGLSMVQGFVRQSGGEAHIMSTPGEGTTIELWLPVANTPPVLPKPIPPEVPKRGRILLVDDSDDVLLVVGSFLCHAHFDVTAVTNGESAMAALANRAFDILITDFLMPEMNGMDLLHRARQMAPDIICMIITGYSEPISKLTLNDVTVMRKPFDRGELVAKVDDLLKVKQLAYAMMT
jgi:PAS domain S-box-containing protein